MSDAPARTVARIITTHGLKGEVTVVPAADLPFMLEPGLKVWIVPPTLAVRQTTVEHVRSGPKGPLLKLAGVDDIDAAATLRGRTLACDPADVPETESDEIDPIGLRVVEDTGRELGSVVEVIVTGANDVWVVDGQVLGQVLLPVIDDVILDIDTDEGTALVHVLPGLIDEEGSA